MLRSTHTTAQFKPQGTGVLNGRSIAASSWQYLQQLKMKNLDWDRWLVWLKLCLKCVPHVWVPGLCSYSPVVISISSCEVSSLYKHRACARHTHTHTHTHMPIVLLAWKWRAMDICTILRQALVAIFVQLCAYSCRYVHSTQVQCTRIPSATLTKAHPVSRHSGIE